MPLPQRDYRDPLEVLIERENAEERRREREKARSCMGCAHRVTLWGLAVCAKDHSPPGDNNMRRCARYEEKQGG